MIKKAFAVAAIFLIFIALIEVINLFRLRASVSSYAQYWKHASTTGDFIYLALGDSTAQGIGASKPQLGYVGLLAKQIEQATGRTVRVINLSVSGAKIADLIKTQLPQLKNYKPDLITVGIGSNDIVHYQPQLFQAQYNQLAAALPTGTVVSNIPYFGGRVRNNAQAIAASQVIAAAATKYDLKLVDLQFETKNRQSLFNYAADLFHPSNKGYENWDTAFWKVISLTVK